MRGALEREKVRKSASARDSHARRICLEFSRERGPKEKPCVPGSRGRESFVRFARAVHVAAARLEPPPSFPPPRSLKCQIIGRTYVRSLASPRSSFLVPPRPGERLDRFLLSPPDGRASLPLPRRTRLNESERATTLYPCMRSFPDSFVFGVHREYVEKR